MALFFASFSTAEDFKIGRADASLTYDIATLSRNNMIIDAAKSIGIDVIFSDLPAKRTLKLVEKGQLDAEIGRHKLIEPLFPNLIRVDEPIGYLDYWVWVPEEDKCIDSREQLSQLKPVGLRGVLFYNTNVYPNSEVGYETVNQPEQLITMLMKNRADYTVHSKQTMDLPIYNQVGRLKPCLDEPLFTLNFYLYLAPAKAHLKERFEITIRQKKYGY